MKITNAIIVFFMVAITSACKKEPPSIVVPPKMCDTTFIKLQTLDTIYPSPYLAAYPGSWWLYDDGHMTESYYWYPKKLYTKTENANGCWTYTYDEHYMPQTSEGIIAYDKRYNGDTTKTQYAGESYLLLLNPIIGEKIEKSSWSGEYAGNKTTTITCDSILGSKVVNGITYYDVVRVDRYTVIYYSSLGKGPHYSSVAFYAKNIGLIEQIHVNIWGDTSKQKLVDYYIAPY